MRKQRGRNYKELSLELSPDKANRHYETQVRDNSQGREVLKNSGILDAFESCITNIINQSQPAESRKKANSPVSIFDQAANNILQWHSNNHDQLIMKQ